MKKKRYQRIDAKPDQLKVAFGMGDWPDNSKDLQYAWGPGTDMKVTARCVSTAFEEAIVHDGKNLREILEDRGFDIESLRFTISKLPNEGGA